MNNLKTILILQYEKRITIIKSLRNKMFNKQYPKLKAEKNFSYVSILTEKLVPSSHKEYSIKIKTEITKE